MSLTESPELIPVNLVRLDGSPALTGYYMVDILPVNADSNPLERFVSLGRQLILLTTGLSEWVHAAGVWYNSTLMSCEGKVAVEFVGWT